MAIAHLEGRHLKWYLLKKGGIFHMGLRSHQSSEDCRRIRRDRAISSPSDEGVHNHLRVQAIIMTKSWRWAAKQQAEP